MDANKYMSCFEYDENGNMTLNIEKLRKIQEETINELKESQDKIFEELKESQDKIFEELDNHNSNCARLSTNGFTC